MAKKRILLIAGIAAPALLLVGIFAFATHFFTQPLMLSVSVGPTTQAVAEATPKGPILPPEALPTPSFGSGILIDLGSKVVNLADPGGYRYVRVGTVLELTPTDQMYYVMKPTERAKEEETLRTQVNDRRAVIDDAMISCLSDKTFGDIFNFSGKEKLKEELRAAINQRLEGAAVTRIYFTEFIIN